MGKLSKTQVVEALKELGEQVDETQNYNVLSARLAELQSSKEDSPEGDEGDDQPEKTDVPDRISSSNSAPVPARLDPPVNPLADPNYEEDYLRKYQYRKQTPFGSKKSDPPAGSKAAIMKAKLLKQERVMTMVPVEQGSDPSVPHTVTLNGYRLDIPKNTYLELPKQVAEVIRTSFNQTVAALSQFQITKEKEQALTR